VNDPTIGLDKCWHDEIGLYEYGAVRCRSITELIVGQGSGRDTGEEIRWSRKAKGGEAWYFLPSYGEDHENYCIHAGRTMRAPTRMR
jgi:hypothetical protein